MMIHGVKLEECSELGVKMTFPDNSYCTLAIDVVYRHPRRPPLELGEENIPTDTDRYARRLRYDKTPEDKEIDEAALKLLYSLKFFKVNATQHPVPRCIKSELKEACI
ncbi:hypothetical protein, partial [Pyramidobacter sp. CG50-2]|uniref:hypothetical protein n=1 Tax=Pyramidobacter sp. CG50-2 TaxID=2382160 RepID=UPI0011C34C12